MNQARKRTGTKKVLSMILVLVMLLSLLSMAAFTLPASETGNSKDSYDYNIMFLDCGRKYYSVDSIKQIIDNASAAGSIISSWRSATTACVSCWTICP